MPGREDGEYELVLGNKQLLGVLFVVIVLLGVFFAIGFLAGRSTSTTAATPVVKAQGELIPIDGSDAAPPKNALPAPAVSEPEPEVAAAKPPAEPPAKAAAPAPVEPSPAEMVADAEQVPAPAPGAYLQVAATTLRDAQSMLNELRKNGHAGTLAQVPNRPGLVRVLVGPLANKEVSAQKREDLRKLGIENPMPQTYR